MSSTLFHTLLETKDRQRLNGLKAGHDVLEQLDLVIDSVRGEFYTRLGLSRLGTILGFLPLVDPPTSDNEYIALVAATTEQKMVRMGLLSWLAVLAKEGGGGRIYQEWNDVGAFRNLNTESRRAEQDRLSREIEDAFRFLSGSATPGAAPRTKAIAIGSLLDDQYRKVGFSLYSNPAYLFHFSLDTSNE